MHPVPTLTDGTVLLRGHRREDAAGVLEQCQDPVTRQWTTVPVPYSLQDAEAFVSEQMPRGWADGSTWGFAVEVGGRFAGTVELRDEGEGRLEVAYGSHPWVRGTGAMEKAVRLMVDWGFAERGAAVVVWRANKGNWASRKLAWRLGFTFEGTIRAALSQRGQLRDAWVGTLLAGDDRRPKGRWLEVPVLEGQGLRLRPWRESDVPRIVEACSDPLTQAWLGQMPAPYEESDALAWLEHQRENRAQGTSVAWAVVDPGDAVLGLPKGEVALGSVSYFGLVPEVEAEIGYWAHPDARGRGLTSRAMGLVLRHLFEDVGVRRVVAGAAVDNVASRHVIEANGLRPFGVERLGTVVRTGRADLAWYDVLLEEWRGSQRTPT
jgi:RimJ/RimL family protein N-acetyltransferase